MSDDEKREIMRHDVLHNSDIKRLCGVSGGTATKIIKRIKEKYGDGIDIRGCVLTVDYIRFMGGAGNE